jgi:CheY-like chemotaxis protein
VSKSIALAEDDSDDQLLFSEALKQVCKESTLHAVSTGMQLLDLLEDNKKSLPDVIVLDVNMPGMSGIECLKIIRQTKGLDHLPVIIMSTSTNPKTIEDAFSSGADSYAVKPGKFDDLKRIVDKIVGTDWAAIAATKNHNNFMMKPHAAIR